MKTPIQQVNKALEAAGREERLIRSPKGYYYLTGGDAPLFYQSGIYQYRLESATSALREVEWMFKLAGIKLDLGGKS